MQGKGLIAVAMMAIVAPMAHAADDIASAASLVALPAIGLAPALFDQASIRLTKSLRFRIEAADETIAALTHGISPLRTQAVDPSRRRRFNSMVDFFPSSDSGFHLTAGMRRAPKRARWSPAAASAYTIFMPKMGSPLRVRSNAARSSPTAMVGWSGDLMSDVHFSLTGGLTQEHGRSLRATSTTIALQQQVSSGWSRIGRVAQVSMRVAF